MSKVQTSSRLDKGKFLEAKKMLKSLGLNFTEVVNIFGIMVVENKGFLFDVKLPIKELQTSIDELENDSVRIFL